MLVGSQRLFRKSFLGFRTVEAYKNTRSRNGRQVRQDSHPASSNPEPPLKAARSLQPTRPEHTSKSLGKLKRYKKTRELDSDSEQEEPPLKAARSLQPTRPEHTSKSLGKLKRYKKTRELDSDSEQEEPPLKAARSSQPTRQKPQRQSLLLREIEAHNQSPEPESELEVEALCQLKGNLGNAPVTRSVSQKLVNDVKGGPPIPRKNLNFNKLMLAQFGGVEEETETFYLEGSSNFEPSSHQRQVRNTVGNSQRDQKLAAGMAAWMRQKHERGQSACYFFPSAKVKLFGYLPPRATKLVEALKQLFSPLQQFT